MTHFLSQERLVEVLTSGAKSIRKCELLARHLIYSSTMMMSLHSCWAFVLPLLIASCDGFSLPLAASDNLLSPNQIKLEEITPSEFPRSWVPIASTFELDPTRPSALQFLGQSYVTYFNEAADRWVIYDDACPHRLAPLSEGRVDPKKKSTLECSYHGWEFDADGKCQTIPQADMATVAKAQSNPKCHVHSYPVHVEKRIIFFWPWKEDVLSCPPELSPETLVGSNVADECDTFTRDLPYSWDILIENIADPSHVPFVSTLSNDDCSTLD